MLGSQVPLERVSFWDLPRNENTNGRLLIRYADAEGNLREESLLKRVIQDANIAVIEALLEYEGLVVTDEDVEEAILSDVYYINNKASKIYKKLRELNDLYKGQRRTVAVWIIDPISANTTTPEAYVQNTFMNFANGDREFNIAYNAFFRRKIIPNYIKEKKYIISLIETYQKCKPNTSMDERRLLERLLVCEMNETLEWSDFADIAMNALNAECFIALAWAILWPGRNSPLMKLIPKNSKEQHKLARQLESDPYAIAQAQDPEKNDLLKASKLVKRYTDALTAIHTEHHLSDQELIRLHLRVQHPLDCYDGNRPELQRRLKVLMELISRGDEHETILYPIAFYPSSKEEFRLAKQFLNNETQEKRKAWLQIFAKKHSPQVPDWTGMWCVLDSEITLIQACRRFIKQMKTRLN
ncbi:hypothetical protein BDV29DRAFT_162888 [Aspergillus leporis]|uniref:Uncharacterized protein n=1 Tax=Aspergillus leporis TaxID=41062 RepID=A0A5N5WJC9_9EURO|nr:hypothetical protein BDV29DRAFT_162888 [Aspergillus leporis]